MTGLSETSVVGGLVGNNYGTITNSYSTGSVTGRGIDVGGLVGVLINGSITNSYATGSVTGSGNVVGGLVGSNGWGTITNCYSTGSVTGTSYVGGLVGNNGGTITNSYATGSVTGSGNGVGGLVGYNDNGTITNSYATGSVTGTSYVGGLVGDSYGYSTNSYATGNVTGTSYVGGLVGDGDIITNSYATGSVTGTSYVGGLVGIINNYGLISNSYATGSVTGTSYVGGLVGINNNSRISNSFWNTTTSGQATSSGGTGLTTTQMQNASNFTGFNFTSTPGATGNNWVIVNNDGTLQTNSNFSGGATYPMLASEYSTTINNTHQLQLMQMALSANYTQGSNINAANTATNTDVWDSSGFVPIGNSTNSFTGTFDGLGRTITGLTINRPSTNDIGLFGLTGNGSFISNVCIVGGSVTGQYLVGDLVGNSFGGGTIANSYATGSVVGILSVGGLVGDNYATIINSYATGSVTLNGDFGSDVGGLVGYNRGTITNSYATGSVTFNGIDNFQFGGLVGNNYYGTITNSYATGSVTGGDECGGLVGYNYGTITNSYATGNVIGSGNYVGGLVGYNYNNFPGYSYGSITNSYAMGSVTGGDECGGLVGCNYGTITNSYATGNVIGSGNYVGGLVGYNNIYNPGYSFGSITNSYATGSVTGGDQCGGLVGYNYGTITNSYATGNVIGSGNYVGGLVGYNDNGTITNSFWNTTTSGQATSSGGGTGKTSAEMMQLSTFSSWNTASPHTIANTGGSGSVWRIYEGHTSPLLTSFLTPLTLADAPDVTTTYNGNSQSAHSTTTILPLLLGSAATGTNAGFYNGYYSTQQGYDITGGNLIIIPKPVLKVVTLNASKVYDGSTMLGAGTVTIETGVTVKGITEQLNYSGATAYSKYVADNGINYINAITLLDGTGLAANYTLPTLNHTNAPVTITPKSVTLSGITAASKVYDGTTTATVNTGSAVFSGMIAGDQLSISATGLFADKNAALGKKVNLSSNYSGLDKGNYSFTDQAFTTADITPKALTVSGLSVPTSKVYDGTTAAVVTGTSTIASEAVGTGNTTDGKSYSGDSVSLSGTVVGTYNSKDVSTASTVTYTGLSLSGSQASNYTLNLQNAASATITPKALTVSGLSVPTSKVYDGTTAAVVSGTSTLASEGAGTGNTTDGKSYTGDSVNLSGVAAGTYNSKDVATASTVTYSGLSISGSQASNYTLTIQSPASAKITPKTVTLSATKTYDGTTTLGAGTVTIGTGVTVNGITELLGYSGATASSKTVVSNGSNYINSITLANGTGGLAANYKYVAGYNVTSNNVTITPKALTMSGLSVAASKVYDGTTKATVSGSKTLATAEAAGTGTASDGKSYTGDTVSITGTAVGTYNSKDVATASTVNYSGLSLTGSQAGNYTLTIQNSASAKITAKAITMSGLSVAASKVYDGTTAAVVSGNGTLAAAESAGTGTATDGKSYTGDVVNIIGPAVGTYNSKDVATAKTVTYSGLSLTGSQSGDYTLMIQSPASAKITPKALSMSGLTVAANKVYDRTTKAIVSGTKTLATAETAGQGTASDGKSYTGDTVSITGTAVGTYNSKDVATATTVTYSGLSLSGSQASDYTLTIQSPASAKITPKALTMSGLTVAASKVYNGTTAAVVSGTKTLAIAEAAGTGTATDGKSYAGDTVSITGTAVGTYNSKDVATASTVTFSGLSLTGSQAGNYTLTIQSPASAKITPKTVTLKATKTYDGTTTLGAGTVTIGTGVTVNGITELLGYSGATAFSPNIANNATNYINAITLLNGTGGILASNYALPTLNHSNAPVTIK